VSGTNRRDLIKSALVLPFASQIKTAPAKPAAAATRPVVVSSANGLEAVRKAYQMIVSGADPLDAVIAGVNIVEDDPDDVTVGYGGIPNEEGVVQLDASVMDGRTMKSGAVGALERIKNPSKVARLVMDRTNRAFLVGEGALKFARAHGVPEQNLLTERSRKIWLYWKEKLSKIDDWIERGDEEQNDPDIKWYIEKYGVEDFRPQGTINCNAVTANGDVVGTTTTSGLFFKLPGRLGDSPVIGAGLCVDNEVGACGSTGWGEGNIRFVGSHAVVELMRQGKSPQQAALAVLQRVVDGAKYQRDKSGRPDFDIHYYVVNKRGEYAGASVWNGSYGNGKTLHPSRFSVANADGVRHEECAYLLKKAPPA
jgi:N4-(beta-N-acetylglucosaminyl)-L-asparaginase